MVAGFPSVWVFAKRRSASLELDSNSVAADALYIRRSILAGGPVYSPSLRSERLLPAWLAAAAPRTLLLRRSRAALLRHHSGGGVSDPASSTPPLQRAAARDCPPAAAAPRACRRRPRPSCLLADVPQHLLHTPPVRRCP